MPLSTAELANAREIVSKILDELRFDAYLFEVEPGEDKLEITVECAVEGGWETVKLIVDKDHLLRGIDDPGAHQLLLNNWRNVLSACLPET